MNLDILPNTHLRIETFLAASHARNTCGNNGLPLTPNSICILGKAQRLKAFTHPNLCAYLDIVRGKHERVVVVSEYYRKTSETCVKSGALAEADLIKIAGDVLTGLQHLHDNFIIHRSLSLSSICFDENNVAKLSQYGLYYMTNNGSMVKFSIGDPAFLSPEVISDVNGECANKKSDVWAFGILMLQLALGKKFWADLDSRQVLCNVLICSFHKNGPAWAICKSNNCLEEYMALSSEFKEFINLCLVRSTKDRSTVSILLNHVFLADYKPLPVPSDFFMPTKLRYKTFSLEGSRRLPIEIREAYYLWQLFGGDPLSELNKLGCIRSKPPVCNMPTIITNEGTEYGVERDLTHLYHDVPIVLNVDAMRQRLQSFSPAVFYPLLVTNDGTLDVQPRHNSVASTAVLPVSIKENDVEYQLRRIRLFKRLIEAYPFTKLRILSEVQLDIPPFYRGYAWAALLGVLGDYRDEYASVDKESPSAMDRQIEVDIPRCHQYDELLSSPEAHRKFKRLLKAWVTSHPQYVYWQGLDSLCAPFMYLHFNDEALAYKCLSLFIDRYLYKFFLQDNSQVIREYLAVFNHLIAYHDPELFTHLDSDGFMPELYSIPWFLTMFTHVFPLHKIFHLWDCLLLGSHSLALLLGLAILQQLRSDLLSFGFNECILLFSDMPDIDIQRCVVDAKRLYRQTPRSALYRQYAPDAVSKPLGMSPVPLDVLKSESCPRICAEELLLLLRLPTSDVVSLDVAEPVDYQVMDERILVVDVRPREQFQTGCIPGSINIPWENGQVFHDGMLSPSPEASALAAHRRNLIVVVGSASTEDACNFANALVRMAYPHVCLLHGQAEIFQSTDVLVVPAT